MATEETEYESDPEELKRALATRRREASDDEDEGLKEPQVDSDDATLEYDDDDSYYDDEEDLEYIADNDKASVAVISEPDASKEEDVVDGEEQKPKEPFAVPTAGAFYMHDDRFQEMDKASNRRMRGGRRLWQSRDQSKWGHDKYEEMNTPQKQYHQTTSRGRARGRGYSRGTNSKAFTTNGHQNQFPKAVTRGRGPRRYEAALRNGNQAPSVQNKQSRNSYVKVSQVDSGRESAEKASTETDAIQAKKNVVASSLNSASPPFYPSGSSINVAQKDLQPGMGRLHVNEKPTPSGKKFGNSKSSLSWVRTAQPSQTTSQGKGAPPPGQALYQQSLNQGDKVSSSMQLRGVSKGTDQNCTQPPGQALNSVVINLLPSSPPKTGSLKNQYLGETDLATESDALLAKGKGTLQPSGKGSFMHGGAQFMGPAGSIAAGQGNPNFPAFLPFMQFGGQHGGVPTFGMALPGYVQPEHGTGNPEMTWLPILTGPGALGASYSPYALPSSVGPSIQENSSSNPNDEEKSMERPDTER